MLRLFVLMLILLNGAYFAWGQGWLLAYGVGPAQQREPQRLAQQIRPQALALISDKEALQLVAATSAPRSAVCLQTGLLDAAQADAVRRVVQPSLPDGAWTMDGQLNPERWIIYMGKYANTAELDKKRAQLANLQLTFQQLVKPELAPGLSLGVYPSQDAAVVALEVLTRRGVRTARVLQELPASQGYRLRVPAVDESMQKALMAVKAALNGKPLETCPTAARP
jgi:hypothetical protein